MEFTILLLQCKGLRLFFCVPVMVTKLCNRVVLESVQRGISDGRGDGSGALRSCGPTITQRVLSKTMCKCQLRDSKNGLCGISAYAVAHPYGWRLLTRDQ